MKNLLQKLASRLKNTEDRLPAPTDGKIFESFVLNVMCPDQRAYN